MVLQQLKERQLYAKILNYEFLLEEVGFIGHVVFEERISVDLAKIKEMSQWESSKNTQEVRSFLGLARYYRRFVEGFSKIAMPMTALTRKNVKLEWIEKYEKSFYKLKMRLTTASVLTIPNGTKGYTIYSYLSGQGLGEVLMKHMKVIAYAS
ncbi:uncharacterized mitochondrial protein AtMg00860-like [Humulus lupulus]|uniref:uncharacterized mitochondrial protein AtMg00860-like n=1 Tax=Humulus lupulus TaxID=3486 RepID=UPI002B4113E5|nr:uncharacterized mitochondrial protein AtMg00860-like [Humulus lupulus]